MAFITFIGNLKKLDKYDCAIYNILKNTMRTVKFAYMEQFKNLFNSLHQCIIINLEYEKSFGVVYTGGAKNARRHQE